MVAMSLLVLCQDLPYLAPANLSTGSEHAGEMTRI